VTRTVELANGGPRRPRVRSRATGAIRASTLESRRVAVERVVATMKDRFDEPLSLDTLAREAFLSAYHFNRVFRGATGVPPGRFLAALRMDAAKQLLLTTPLRVTDICLDVGYRSLGTFTTHFRQLVGISPSRLRRLANTYGDEPVSSLAALDEGAAGGATLDVRVRAYDGFEGTAFVGLFRTPLPQTRPSGCIVVSVPADAGIACEHAGPFYALASAYAPRLTIRDALLVDAEEARVASAPAPVAVGERAGAVVELRLRRLGVLDPPILLALPLVLADARTVRRTAA
jgi:AraC family transcriptional regulator